MDDRCDKASEVGGVRIGRQVAFRYRMLKTLT
jgi:hypothetical protein